MRSIALCAILVACKGSKAPDKTPQTEERAPDPAPRVTTPSPTCYLHPFGLDAERAGIRRLAHRPTPLPSVTVKRDDGATFDRAIDLVPGVPTKIDVAPHKEAPHLAVPNVGADSIVATAKIVGDSVTVTAPAHLDGAVIEIDGKTFVRAQIGENGRRALDLYQARYVAKRYSDPEGRYHGGRKLTALWPISIIADDVDGDGKTELVALSRVDVQMPDSDRPIDIPDPYDLAIIWLDSDAYTNVWLPGDATLYLVPPGLAGGKPMLVSARLRTKPLPNNLRGTTSRLELARVVLDGRKLLQLAKDDAEEEPPDPDNVSITDPRCLQTSPSSPATWVGIPSPE